MKYYLLIFYFSIVLNAQDKESPLYKDDKQEEWVNNQFNTLTIEERVGQLFMIEAYTNKDQTHTDAIKKLIEEENVGGIIFMQDNAIEQVKLTNSYQLLSKIPLLISIDAEWDLSMRLKNTNKFPWALTIGATNNQDKLAFKVGRKIAEHCKRMGIHINFGPVVDINTNPNNPIIGNRSFGSDKENVTTKAIDYMRGMQEFGVLGSAKHFPGHGDTDKDSHLALPFLNHSVERLEEIELYPFKKLIDAKVGAIMVAHLNVPSLEADNLPATLSKKIVTDLLKTKLGYKGLIITDALNMKGVLSNLNPGEIELKAFEAGNDILLFSQAVKEGKQKIIEAVAKDSIFNQRLEESVKKILRAKYFMGLNNKPQEIKPENLLDDLSDAESKALTFKIYEKAITVLKNEKNNLPIKEINKKKFAYVSLEEGENNVFFEYLNKYANFDKINIKSTEQTKLLSGYDYVVISINKPTESPYKSYVSSANTKSIVSAISKQNNTILCLFTSPYGLNSLDTAETKSVIIAYENNETTQTIVPQVIFGAIEANGTLPVDVNNKFMVNSGIYTKSIGRLGYALPENVAINSNILFNKIDRLATNAIENKATPGMQILVARNGKIIYEKALGHHTYEKVNPVKLTDLYDLASVTKVIVTIPLIMLEVDRKNLSVDDKLGKILQKAKGTNKENIILKEMLAHQAGLPDWLGFYKETVNTANAKLYLDYYSRTPSKDFSIKIADNIYMLSSMKDSIYNSLYKIPLGSKKYVYSDLGYYFLKQYLEEKNLKPLEIQAKDNFFDPLEMNATVFNPLEKFSLENIIPTEKDKYYRNRLIHGSVHDQGAIMMGGVAAHAGLFSTASDLAKMLFMFSNNGEYAGKKLLNKEVINEFTSYQFKDNHNRRGLGFDKKPIQNNKTGPSEEGYGHLGYTGTKVWVDPKYNLIYVFLSNRVHPSDSKLLNSMGTRENIQQAIYEAMMDTTTK